MWDFFTSYLNWLAPILTRDTLLSMGTPNQSASPAVGVSLPAWLENAAQSALILGRLVQDPSIQAL